MTATKTNYLLLAKKLLARSQQALTGANRDPFAAVAAFDKLLTAKDSLNDPLPPVRSNALEQIAQVVQTHSVFFTGRDDLGNAVIGKVKTIAATDVDTQVQSQAAQLDTVLDASCLKRAQRFRLTAFPLAR